MTTSLLDEIAGTKQVSTSSVASIKAAIIGHLRTLCTTRRGTMVVAPKFGIDDVTVLFHEMPGGMEEIRLQLEETIRLYEPRLVAAKVATLRGDPHDLTLRFEISAMAAVDGRLLPVRFTAAIDGTRRSVSA